MCADARATVVWPDSIGWRSASSVCLGKLRQFVQEQHATMRQADLARLGPLAAAGHCRLRRRMVRLTEWRPHHQPSAGQETRNAVDHADLERLAGCQVGQQSW